MSYIQRPPEKQAFLSLAIAVTATLIEAVARPIIAPLFRNQPLVAQISLLAISLMSACKLRDSALSFIQISIKTEARILGGILRGISMIYLNGGRRWYKTNRTFINT